MQFSNIIQGACSAIFSQDSSLIAISNGSKILIKDINQELINRNVYSFQDIITHMEFSPDNQLILVVQSNSSAVEIKNFNDEQWVCRIVDQACGILHAVWAPDSKSIITFSDFQMKATVYSLTDKQQYLIKNPKYPDRGISFSSDGKFMALAERRDIKDYIGIYYTKDWKLVNHFQVDTMDLVDIQWSKDDGSILVWDSSINKIQMLIINQQYKFLVYHPSNGLVQRIQPYEYALGIRCVELSNTPHFIAIGSYDEKVTLFFRFSFAKNRNTQNRLDQQILQHGRQQLSLNTKPISKNILMHVLQFIQIKRLFIESKIVHFQMLSTQLIELLHNVKQTKLIFGELTNKILIMKQLQLMNQQINYQQQNSLLINHYNQVQLTLILVLMQTIQLLNQVDFQYNQNIQSSFPNAVFIWEVSLLELRYIVLLQNPVKGFLWSHNSNNLIIYAGSNKIYFWSLDGASVCELPQYGKSFSVNKVLWNKNSKCLVLIDRRDAIIGYPPIDLEYTEEQEDEQREEYEN